jgi:hypothetical protein
VRIGAVDRFAKDGSFLIEIWLPPRASVNRLSLDVTLSLAINRELVDVRNVVFIRHQQRLSVGVIVDLFYVHKGRAYGNPQLLG